MKALADGYVMFSEYCEKRNIERNGNEIRKLKSVPDDIKCNLTPNGRSTWAVDEKKLDELWGYEGKGDCNAKLV